MANKSHSLFFLVASALTIGGVLGMLEIAIEARAHKPSLKSYQAIQMGDSWENVRVLLAHSTIDCESIEPTRTVPSFLHCSDYWWTYSFYIDPKTSRVIAKRFYPTSRRPSPLRWILD